jgi:UDP-2,4-diacetamido-2,4,6-trideoxy-beta-L-altropyranose hydrolase
MMRALFRCDASPAIGAGHAMRCLATAETLKWASWEVAFMSSGETLQTVPALAREGVSLTADGDLADSDVIVFDHYDIDAAGERQTAGALPRTVAFEDRPNRRHDVDILVDPTPLRQRKSYDGLVGAETVRLVGPAYAQLRRSWLTKRADALARRSRNWDVRRVLVSMGATDPLNATAKVLEALAHIEGAFELDVVLGPSAPHLAVIREALAGRGTLHVDPPDFPRLVADADLAIGAAGSSCFERACLGLPALIVELADNQADLIAAFEDCGAARAATRQQLEDSLWLARIISELIDDEEARAAMSETGQRLVDGRGPQRLLLNMIGFRTTGGGAVTLRLAEADDEDWLLQLQARPETRRYAINPTVPSLSEHASWMKRMLASADSLLSLVEHDGKRCGMVRLDRLAGQATAFQVSIAIDPALHGRGIATAALKLTRRAFPKAELVATVLRGNSASQSLFERAGYRKESEELFRSAVS